jgi:hypothetical protein
MDSKGIPDNLRALVAQIKGAKLPVRFLLFTGDQPAERTRILLFRKSQGLSSGYLRRELQVDAIAEVAPLLGQYLGADGFDIECYESSIQDYFVCTHGSHDKCCAHYGYPFYRQARKIVADLNLDTVRVWQVSHIGGHRFAPTLIGFPDGRYYGALDTAAFSAIIQQQGDIQCLKTVYRGWGILPKQAQIVEQELLLQQGWGLFNRKTISAVVPIDEFTVQVTLCYETVEGLEIYRAIVFADASKTQYLIGSCGQTQPSEFTKYSIRELEQVATVDPNALSQQMAIA